MANEAKIIAEEIRSKQGWSGAEITRRDRGLIELSHPTENKKALYVSVGGAGLHKLDGTEIDTSWQPSTGAWQHEMVLGDEYQAHARNIFNAGDLIEFRHSSGEWVIFDPQSINWVNQDNSRQRISINQEISSQISDNILQFTNGYGPGIHFQYTALPTKIIKLITIDSLANLPNPTVTGTIDFEAEFAIKNSVGIELYLDGIRWARTNNVLIKTANQIEFRNNNNVTLFYLEFPKAWDSLGGEVTGQYEVRRQGSSYFITVRIPRQWLLTAQYPVYIDPTIDSLIAVTADDGQFGGGGLVNNAASFRIGNSGGSLTAFLRFDNMTVDGTIDVAYLKLKSGASNQTGAVATIIYGEDAADPNQLSTLSDAYNRPKTSASSVYNISSGSSWANNAIYSTSSIVSIVQYLVDTYTYSGSQAMQFFIVDNASGSSRAIRDYTVSTGNGIHIEYTASNFAPSVALNTSASSIFTTGCPLLEFTGTDTEGEDIQYQIQISSNPEFSGSGVLLTQYTGSAVSGGFHENPTGGSTWQGYGQVDDRFGISFLGRGGILDKVLMPFGSDGVDTSGSTLARIYGHQGVYGSGCPLNAATLSNVPTSGCYAESEKMYFTGGSFAGSWHTYSFTGDNRILLQYNTPYFVIADWIPENPWSYDNLLEFSTAATSGIYPGNTYIDGYSANWGIYTPMNLTFQVYEDTTLYTKTSGSDNGFLNTVTGSDTSPFISGEKISYTVQSGSPLSSGSYFWRVRGIDPSGGNIYGNWSEIRNFGVNLVQSTLLTVQDSSHGSTTDNIDLISHDVISVFDSDHVQISDNLDLTQGYVLETLDSNHVQGSDNIILGVTISLVVADSDHIQTVDNPALTQAYILATTDSDHIQTVDNSALTQAYILATTDSDHIQTVDNPALTQAYVLVIADSNHVQIADNVSFSIGDVLVIADSNHAQTTDNLELIQKYSLEIFDSNHSQLSDNIDINVGIVLIVANSNHGHTSDEIILSNGIVLITSDSNHGHTSDNVELVQSYVLTIDDSNHIHDVDNLELIQSYLLSIFETDHIHTSDNINLTNNIPLIIFDSDHIHNVDNVTLTQKYSLLVNDAFHESTSDSINFIQAYLLVVLNTTHIQSADNIEFIPEVTDWVYLTLKNRSIDFILFDDRSIDFTLSYRNVLFTLKERD